MNQKSKTFINRVLGFSLSSWVNSLITLVATPVTTALFSPEEFGKIALFISYANILVPFVYMGFDQAYVRFYNEPCGTNDKRSLFRLCSVTTLLLSLLVSIAVVLLWDYFSYNIVGYPNFWIALSLIVYVVAFLLSRMCNLKSRMDNNVGQFTIQTVISTLIIKLSFVVVVVIAPKAEYAIYLRSALLLLVFTFFFYAAWRKCDSPIDNSKPVMRELGRFALPLFPTTLLVMLNISLSQLMLKRYVDFSMMGIYSNAVTIAGLITIAQSGLNTFWTPFVYEYYKDPRKIQRMHHIFSLLMFIIAFLILIFQDLVYLVLVNRSFWESKSILALLLISPVCEVLSETLGLGIELSKKTYLKLPIYAINIIVNVVACIILIPQWGILGAALANALASLSMLVAKTIIGERFYKCSDKYVRLEVSMVLLVALGFVNYYCHTYICCASIASLLFIGLLYRSEAELLITHGIQYIREKI